MPASNNQYVSILTKTTVSSSFFQIKIYIKTTSTLRLALIYLSNEAFPTEPSIWLTSFLKKTALLW